jgi:glycosyltransferase involved in cell wall biosynthesis/LmbE family N-acetylglucosaminyl deacetylase
MRILIAGSTYPPHNSGQSIFTSNLANSMAEFGHDVMVLTPSVIGQPSRRITQNGILHWVVRSLDLSILHQDLYIAFSYEGMVNEALDTFQPEIIHLQDSAPLSCYLLRAARQRDIPAVITHHIGPAIGAPYLTWFTNLLNGKMEAVVWSWVIRFLNQADVLTAPSTAAANMLRSRHVKPPVWPISCGVSTRQFQAPACRAKQALRDAWGLPDDRTVFLYVGRLDWEKQPEVMLHAMALLPAQSALLVLAGTGGVEPALKTLAKKLNLEGRVLFLGDVQHDKIPGLYHAADIFVMPGDAESLSIATLEAMASGKPILAANSMALPELVKNGENGLLFQPRNAQDAAHQMQWFIDHPEAWARLGQSSIAKASQHNIPDVMRQFEALYRQTAAHTSKRRARPQAAPLANPVSWLSHRFLPHLKAVFLLLSLLVFSATMYSETIAAPHIRIESLPPLQLEDTQRMLIISPHPDDLVLVAGGLIQRAAARGVQIQAVIVTHGEEAGLLPSWRESHRSTALLNDYRRVQTETILALEELGIAYGEITFLGYPSDQWQANRLAKLPEPMELRQYRTGNVQQTHRAALKQDLLHLLYTYSPDMILIPHPEDYNPDHRAVSNAARKAAAVHAAQRAERMPRVLGYLVEYETYPDSMNLINLSPLLPPANLTDYTYTWYSVSLDEAQVQTKRKAINMFPLGGERIGWVVSSFARPNEVFTPLIIQHMPPVIYHRDSENRVEALLDRLPTLVASDPR